MDVAGPVIIECLVAAVGIAVNPPAVVASIVLVSSARHKAVALAGGWVVGLFAVGSVVMLVGDVTESWGGPSKLAHVVFRTSRFEAMRDWYCDVLAAAVVHENDGMLAFLTYDDEHHRFAFANMAVLDP